jgi:hypothetical protein
VAFPTNIRLGWKSLPVKIKCTIQKYISDAIVFILLCQLWFLGPVNKALFSLVKSLNEIVKTRGRGERERRRRRETWR